MATYFIRVIQRWIGTQFDIKPTGVAIMSEFYEYDTRDTYVTYDGTNWIKYSNG